MALKPSDTELFFNIPSYRVSLHLMQGQQGQSRIEGAVQCTIQCRLAACVDISIYDRRHSRPDDFLCESDPFGDILNYGDAIFINVIHYHLSEV